MKIRDIEVFLAKEWRTFLFVYIETDNGIYGIGESGITGREKAVAGTIEHLKPLLIGQDPFRTEQLWQQLWRGGFYPAGQILASAIAAIDIALWDIKGKALDMPVYQLLGGKVRDKVLTYNHLHGESSDDIVVAAKKSAEEGWRCSRWEFFAGPDNCFVPEKAIARAVHEWELLREALGNEYKLCFDMHTKVGVADAVGFCRAVEPYQPFFIEDPIRSENPLSYQRIRAQTSVPIAAGEQLGNKWDFRELIEKELIDYARIDVCIAGGLTEAKKIAAMCETHFIDIAVHNPIGPVSSAACLHLNLSSPNVLVQELPKKPGETLPGVFPQQLQWQEGYLLAPDGVPGLGIEFNQAAIGEHAFEITELPHLHREDGSFNNW